MSKYILRYFYGTGRGEIIRLLLVLKGVDFEDIKFTSERWPAEKTKTPFGQVPVLTIDGKDYTESFAIARFLANEFDFYGSSNQDKYEIDQVTEICQDLFELYVKAYFADKAVKAQHQKDIKEIYLPRYLGNIEKLMAAKGTGYCVGDELSLGDLAIWDICDGHIDDKGLDNYPHVKAIVHNVTANANIKAYLKRRTYY